MGTSLKHPSGEVLRPARRKAGGGGVNRLTPVRIAVAWSMATYVLFVFGPWAYPMRYSVVLFALVALYNLSIYAGFRRGATRPPRRHYGDTGVKSFNIDRLLNFAFFATLVLFPIRLVIATQNYSLDWSLFVSKVVTGLSSAQENYSQRFVVTPPGIWGVLNHVNVLLGFIAWLYVPLLVLVWERASMAKRALGVVVVIGSILASVARGQNFGAFDVVAQLVAFILIRRAGFAAKNGAQQKMFGGRAWKILAPALFVFFFLSFFANTMKSRIGDQFRSLLVIQGGSVPIDESSALWNLTPPPLQPVFASISMYVSHGYAALRLAVDESFSTTYGIGGSYFLLDNASELDPGLQARTFQAKLEASQGYDSHALWHTAYLWIANDVSLLGVPIILYGMFMLFGRAWRDYVERGNLFGALMMAPMTAFVALISSSNQIAGQPHALFGTFALIFAWLGTRHRVAWPPRSASRSAGRSARRRVAGRG